MRILKYVTYRTTHVMACYAFTIISNSNIASLEKLICCACFTEGTCSHGSVWYRGSSHGDPAALMDPAIGGKQFILVGPFRSRASLGPLHNSSRTRFGKVRTTCREGPPRHLRCASPTPGTPRSSSQSDILLELPCSAISSSLSYLFKCI